MTLPIDLHCKPIAQPSELPVSHFLPSEHYYIPDHLDPITASLSLCPAWVQLATP